MKICWDTLDGIRITSRGNFARYRNGKRVAAYKYNEECSYCNEPYFTSKRKMSKYCSPKCNNMENKRFGISNGNYSHGSYCNNGYPSICVNGINRKVHTVIAEKILGRKLKRNECVHHVDLNKSNNLNSNLVICDLAYHRFLHHRMAQSWVKNVLLRKV